MELRHLRYFEAVATELNFRRAAERLHVAQPALSRQIRDLEEDMRVRLLDRDTVRVQLTDAGRVFLEQAREILQAVQRATDDTREAAAGRRGRLIVGNVGPVTARFMPGALARFRTEYPDVDVDLIEIEPADQIAALDRGTIQVAFTVERSPALPRYLSRRVVLRSTMAAIVGPRHRLAGAKRVALAELAHEKLLCFAGQKSQTHAELVRAILAAHALKPRAVKIIAGFESLLAMIAGGEGVSLMPAHIPVADADPVRVIPLQETSDELAFEISAVWRNRQASPLAANFVRVVSTARSR